MHPAEMAACGIDTHGSMEEKQDEAPGERITQMLANRITASVGGKLGSTRLRSSILAKQQQHSGETIHNRAAAMSATTLR